MAKSRLEPDSYTDQSQLLYRLSQILVFVLLLRLYNFEFVFTVVKSTMPLYQKLRCCLSAPYILVACDGGLERKKKNTDDHLSMCNCSGGTELDKAVKFRMSRSARCTISRGEQIPGWCTNSRADLCAGARLREGIEYAVTPAMGEMQRHVYIRIPVRALINLTGKGVKSMEIERRHPESVRSRAEI